MAVLLMTLCAAIAHPLEHMEHRRWLAADGGPSQIGAIAQTRDGYLWLGTNDSLFRFDGFRFSRYEAPDGHALGIVSTLLAVEDALWVGLRAGGIDVVEPGRIHHHRPGSGLPPGVIYGLAIDRSKMIWAAADDGLARFDGTGWQTIADNWHFPGHKARAVFVDRSGVLWAANENRLFYLPAGGRSFMDAGLTVDWVSQIAQAPDGALWVMERYSGRIHRVVLSQGKTEVTSGTIHSPSNGMLFDRHGALWISTLGNGLQYVARPSDVQSLQARQSFTVKDGLSSDHIWPMLDDSEGNLWIGTNAGLDRLRSRTLMPSAFPSDALNYALVADPDGGVWAGSSNRPALRLADGHLHLLDMPPPVTCAMRDADGQIWMAGPRGIWRAQADRLQFVMPLPVQERSDSAVRAMASDKQGRLWVSINRLGLFRLQDGAWRRIPPPTAIASQLMPVSAAGDGSGRVWFGYRDNLLVRHDGESEKRWSRSDGLHIGHVTAISPQRERIWVGGQYGIGWVENDRFNSLRLPENGLFNNIYALIAVPAKDGAGDDLWIHSKSGIFQLAAAELARSIADPSHQIRYRSYELMGGLANDPYQVLPLPTAVRSADGRLWFSTSNGVVWIDPDVPNPDDVAPTVKIESVIVDGMRLAPDKPVTLGPNAQRLVIDYTALSLSAPESLYFRYRLDGYDKVWRDAGRQREAVYAALGAGDYRFRVVAHNKDGLPSAQEAVFAFSIQPVFYERPLFMIVIGALIFGALLFFYRTNARRAAERMRERLEERHSERERIARELHDTLLQGIHGLMLRFQAVADTMPTGDPARVALEGSLDRAEEVVCEGRDRVRALRNDVLDARALHDCVRTLGEEFSQQSAAAFSLTVRGTPTKLCPAVRDEAYRIAHEAIANAFLHADAKRIDVDIDYLAHQFCVRIRDDGRGIDTVFLTQEGRPNHWGLRGMRERAHRIGASLTIGRQQTGGTVALLTVAPTIAYEQAPRRFLGWWHNRKKRRAEE